jgi:hypothetical protein
MVLVQSAKKRSGPATDLAVRFMCSERGRVYSDQCRRARQRSLRTARQLGSHLSNGDFDLSHGTRPACHDPEGFLGRELLNAAAGDRGYERAPHSSSIYVRGAFLTYDGVKFIDSS